MNDAPMNLIKKVIVNVIKGDLKMGFFLEMKIGLFYRERLNEFSFYFYRRGKGRKILI